MKWKEWLRSPEFIGALISGGLALTMSLTEGLFGVFDLILFVMIIPFSVVLDNIFPYFIEASLMVLLYIIIGAILGRAYRKKSWKIILSASLIIIALIGSGIFLTIMLSGL